MNEVIIKDLRTGVYLAIPVDSWKEVERAQKGREFMEQPARVYHFKARIPGVIGLSGSAIYHDSCVYPGEVSYRLEPDLIVQPYL